MKKSDAERRAEKEAQLTQERLRSMVSYNPETGDLIWVNLNNPILKGRIGTRAGALSHRGYLYLRIDGYHHRCHRLAWFYHYGDWPDLIDHINHNTSDNRIANLRRVDPAENSRNITMRKDNKSGVTGVGKSSSCNKWVARIKVNRKDIHLGMFSDIEEAAAARDAALIKYGFHPNHGKPPLQPPGEAP